MYMELVLWESDPTAIFGGGNIEAEQWVTMVTGVVLPILTALVTKPSFPPQYRALVLLVLSTISAGLNELLVASDENFQVEQWIFDTVIIFVIGVASLYGLWKPTGISDAAKRALVTDRTPPG